MRELFTIFSNSLISLIGAVLTTLSALAFFTLFAIHLAGFEGGAYSGIIAFLIIPSIFIIGLLLIPLGVWLHRRKQAKLGETGPARSLVIDFNVPRHRRIALAVIVLTFVNVVVASTATYKGVAVMDSTEFCGGACHTVMNPEYDTYLRSPHSRVKCTECHIGEGADWFVKSKLAGAWQLVSVALDLYPRPIPTPVHNLRPARETCEQCHWPNTFIGDRLRIRSRFDEDESNTEKKNVYLLNVGGIANGQGKGIHWHVDPNIRIRYQADARRENIYDIELTLADGTTKLFKPEEGTPAGNDPSWRTMDCIDCHNRPTHIYQYPNEAVDVALAAGHLDKTLPFIKREGLRIIQLDYPSHEAARVEIRTALRAFYQQEHPELLEEEGARVDKAAEVLATIHNQNVFPTMRIEWGTYPNFAYEHVGCFRCHDKKHATDEGERISARCSTCHSMLANEEEEPEILEILYP